MADASASSPFAQPTTSQDAEAMFTALGLTEDIIKQALRVADAEDARIDTVAHDTIHRGVNRWGHVLANLRGELAGDGWDWERVAPTLRSVLAPGGHIQVCVAAARWVNGTPHTLPRGWHTLQAIQDNRQIWIPAIGQPRGRAVPTTVTWIVCFQPIVTPPAEEGRSGTIEYRYEISEPMTIVGAGSRKRVVGWRLRCFEGSISFDRPVESLRVEDEYDHESTQGLDDLIDRR